MPETARRRRRRLHHRRHCWTPQPSPKPIADRNNHGRQLVIPTIMPIRTRPPRTRSLRWSGKATCLRLCRGRTQPLRTSDRDQAEQRRGHSLDPLAMPGATAGGVAASQKRHRFGSRPSTKPDADLAGNGRPIAIPTAGSTLTRVPPTRSQRGQRKATCHGSAGPALPATTNELIPLRP